MTWAMLDLFSGIGGFSLAARWTRRIETLAFCEIEPFCRAVLAKHWPDIPCHEDIRTTDWTVYRGRVDLLTGGFPCQDISVAGKGAGLEGERSGLWFDLLRAIREARPRWCCIENVPALYHRGIDTVLGGLEEAGYSCWPLVVGADDVGAPHRRKRVWIVARRDGAAIRESERVTEGRAGPGPARPKELAHGLRDGRGEGDAVAINTARAGLHALDHPHRCDSAMAHADDAGRREQLRPIAAGCGGQHAEQSQPVGRRGGSAPTECNGGGAAQSRVGGTVDGLQDWMDGCAGVFGAWPARPGEAQHEWEEPRTARGIRNRAARLKGLGNAVVPQVAYAVLMAILAADDALREESEP